VTPTDIAQFAGVALAAAGLGFTGMQTRFLVKTNQALVYQNIISLMADIDRLFVEHPLLRPFFYDKTEPPPPGELRCQVDAMAELLLDFMDNYFIQAPHMPVAGDDQQWQDYFAEEFDASPALRALFESKRNWYDGALLAIGEAALARARET
jgi:hypothetical protein